MLFRSVTAGTSRLNLLSSEETATLNRVVAQTAGPGVLTIGATPPSGSTDMASELARRAVDDGCDAVLLYFPERHYGDDAVFEYYAQIAARSKAPLMIHGVPLESGQGKGRVPYSLSLCRRLAGLDAVVGMKEEFGCEAVRYELAAHLGDRIPLIVAGASMRKYLGSALYGVCSWLVGVGSFVPRIEEEFFALMERGDHEAALAVVTGQEEPLFEVAMSMGWHVAMRALLDILGLMPGYERAPMARADQSQREQLQVLAARLGWLSE